MNKRQTKSVLKKIEQREQDIAKVRDKLDEDIAYMSELLDDCNTSIEELQHARDALSKFV